MPVRPSRKAAFTKDEEKIEQERDKLDDVLGRLSSLRTGEPPRLQSVPALPTTPSGASFGDGQISATAPGPVLVAEVGERVPEVDAPDSPASTASALTDSSVSEASGTGSGGQRERRPGKAVVPAKHAEDAAKKPPAAWISTDVYLRLVDYSDKEKRMKRAAARPFGVIVMDAIENHAEVLASAWKGGGASTPQPGKLFVREISSRYRRHDLPPRSITMQGIGPENARLLKRLKKQWGAGSVSDLVEKALRLEFGMGAEQD